MITEQILILIKKLALILNFMFLFGAEHQSAPKGNGKLENLVTKVQSIVSWLEIWFDSSQFAGGTKNPQDQ